MDRSTASQLLSLLNEAEKPLSGALLGQKLGISRQAVWKGISGLTEEGFEIERGGRGYRLRALPKRLHAEALRLLLAADWPDALIQVKERTQSTNLDVKQLLDTEQAPLLLVAARAQEGGRGRLGRSFFSPPGGLYFSFAWHRDQPIDQVGFITILAAVAVYQAVKELCGRALTIKWVNDLELAGRKVCGILTEGRAGLESGVIDSLLVGIGLNVRTPEGGFPAELDHRAGALFDQAPQDLNENRLLAAIVQHYFDFAKRPQDGLALYRARCSTLGQMITYQGPDQRKQRGRALAIDDTGGLVVADADDRRSTLRFGEVQLIKEPLPNEGQI